MTRHEGQRHVPLPLSAEGVTPGWLTAALSRRYPGVAVQTVTIRDTLYGSATKVFLDITYNEAGTAQGLPRRMVLKIGFNEAMRALAAHAYARETLFYQLVAPAIGIPLPQCYFAETDNEAVQSAQLLEDLTARGCSFGHIAQPLTVDQMAEALDLLARVHIHYWDRTDLPELGPFASSDVRFSIVDYLLGEENWLRCMQAPRIAAIPKAVLDRVRVERAIRRLRVIDRQGPQCLLHGDPHLGNFYFEPNRSVRLLDWQAATIGSWDQDVAYAITCALSVDDRRANERHLLRHYLDHLEAARLANVPSFDDAWRAYRRQVAYGLTGLLCTLEMQTEEYAAIMGGRFAQAMVDLDTLSLLERET